MSSGWRRFQLVVSRANVAPAAALLEMASGALSATETRAATATVSVYTPEAAAAQAASRIRMLLARVQRQRILTGIQLRDASVREEDWAASWKRFYRPLQAARGLYVVPTWQKKFRAPHRAKMLRLDPGMAFGTGQHPSTQLALNLLLALVRRGDTVIDIGCGSGILSLAAAQCGASVYASDVDPIAVRATKANFAINHFEAAAVRCARGIPNSFPSADVITANITARVLLHLAVAFGRRLRRHGLLIASGFIEQSRGELVHAMQKAGLSLVAERTARPWLAHVYQK